MLSCKFKKHLINGTEIVESIDIKYFNTPSSEIFISSSKGQWFSEHITEPLMSDIEEFQ